MKAIERKERIMVYGDYDVDGTTRWPWSRRSFEGCKCLWFPTSLCATEKGTGSRPRGGARQGVGVHGVDHPGLRDQRFDALAAAAEVGIDTIVCDHHLPADTLPTTTALLNPKKDAPTRSRNCPGRGRPNC